MSYFKIINDELFEAPSVRTSTFSYTEADHGNRSYPTSTGWYWFATLSEARASLVPPADLVARIEELELMLERALSGTQNV